MAANPRYPRPSNLSAKIRRSLLEAARAEVAQAPFALSGRSHEPLGTLDRWMAAVVRSIRPPNVVIRGDGANKYYLLRIFGRAAVHVSKQFGWPALAESRGTAWRQDLTLLPTDFSQITKT